VGLGEGVEERIQLAVGGDQPDVLRLGTVFDSRLDAALSDLALPAHVLPVTLRVQESEEFGKLVLGVCRRAGASP